MEIRTIANEIYKAFCVCGWTGFPSSSRNAVDREATMHTNHCEKHKH